MPQTAERKGRGAALRQLFVQVEDPFAGADMPTVRNAFGVLLALHAAIALAFLPIAPPSAAGGPAGWVVAGAIVAASAAAAFWIRSERAAVTFDRLIVLTYAGLLAPVTLELLSGRFVPYQLLFMVWVGCAAIQPARRAIPILGALVFAAIVPILSGDVDGDLRDALASSVLFTTIGLVLTAYVAHVRRQRTELRTGERAAQAVATAATRRVRDLQWVTDAALSHLELDDLLHELLDRIERVLEVDHGGVLLCDAPEGPFHHVVAHGMSAAESLEVDPSDSAEFPGRVARDRRPVAFERLDPRGDLEAALADAGVSSLIGVPLPLGDRFLGVLYLASCRRRRFSEDEATFLQLVADRAALAVERARLFEDERHIAKTLQHSLLPDELPELPDARIAARYISGGPGIEVGGDWYDVLELGDGRIALTIGDVVGRGLRAASLMGRLRTALQAYALEGHGPAAVLERLHALLEGQPGDAIATVLLLVVDPDEHTVDLANAGHLPALVRDASGAATYLDAPRSPPLGAVPFARFEEERARIEPGSTLALFTDGLVERRGTSLEARLEELRGVVQAAPAAPGSLCDAAIEAMLDGPARDDDVALLVLKLEPLRREGFTLDLPAEPEVLGRLRKLVERWLSQTSASPSDVYAIKAATVEACANAIEHAYRPGDAAFQVRTTVSDNEICVTVRDYGTWRGPRGTDRNRGLLLMDALMDSAEVTSSPEGSTVRLCRRVGEERSL